MRVTKIVGNRLLLGFIAAVLLYWGPGAFLPSSFLSSVVSLTLLVFGGLTFTLYLIPAYEVLVHMKRDDMSSGGHLNILGTFLISAGLVWSGVYGLAWVLAGQPYGWAGTMTSNFGRVMLGSGMFLSYIAPQTTETGIEMQARVWVWGAVLVAFAAGFLLASQLSFSDDTSRFMQSRVPSCPENRPIWGSSTKKYHVPESPYRLTVRPVACFASETEAQSAGFVRAKD